MFDQDYKAIVQRQIENLESTTNPRTFDTRLRELYGRGGLCHRLNKKEVHLRLFTMLKNKFKRLSFSAYNKLDLLMLQTRDGWTLGITIARYRDAATTQQYLNFVSKILANKSISAKAKLNFLKLKTINGWTLGMHIARYQDVATTQQYLNLESKILLDESISAQAKLDFLMLQTKDGRALSLFIDSKQDAATNQQHLAFILDILINRANAAQANNRRTLGTPIHSNLNLEITGKGKTETQAIFWRMAIPYFQKHELLKWVPSRSAKLLFNNFKSKDSLSADDYVILGRLVECGLLNYKDVRAELGPNKLKPPSSGAAEFDINKLKNPTSVAAVFYNHVLAMNPKSDANYYLAEQLLSGNMASELYTGQSFYGAKASELNLSVTERALCLLDRVPDDSLLYAASRSKINSLIDGNQIYQQYKRLTLLFQSKPKLSTTNKILHLALHGQCYTAKCMIDRIPESSPDYRNALLIKTLLIHLGFIHILDDSNEVACVTNYSDTSTKLIEFITTLDENEDKYLALCYLVNKIREQPVDEHVIKLLCSVPEQFTTAYAMANKLLKECGYEQQPDNAEASCFNPEGSWSPDMFSRYSEESSFNNGANMKMLDTRNSIKLK